MTRGKEIEGYLRGAATHRRTEGDYMRTLLDAVTLDDWREVVSETLQAAKLGNAQARAWLAQYLVGKPEGKAPTPLTVVARQLNADDPLVERLSKLAIDRELYPSLHSDDDWKGNIRASVAVELSEKVTDGKLDP